jgi:hypothetical protein
MAGKDCFLSRLIYGGKGLFPFSFDIWREGIVSFLVFQRKKRRIRPAVGVAVFSFVPLILSLKTWPLHAPASFLENPYNKDF